MDSSAWDSIVIITLVVGVLWLLKRNQNRMNRELDEDIKNGRLGEVAIRQMMSTVRRVQQEETEREQRKD